MVLLPEPAAVVAITDGRLCIIHQGESSNSQGTESNAL